MPVMAVNNENQHEPAGDYWARPRWSVGKKMSNGQELWTWVGDRGAAS
jgi:hypothetical protein